MRSTFLTLFLTCPLAVVSTLFAADNKPATKITYNDHVKPIFRAKCFACHNGNKKSSGLDLTSYASLMQGGSSGDVIEPGNAADSYLYLLVTHKSEPNMPPKSEKLAAASLETIRKWIDGGALENSGSKPVVAKKKVELAIASFGNKRPPGPPPMPGRLSRQPVLHTAHTTAVTALATSPWANLVAVAGQTQVFLYDSKTLSLLGVLPFPEGVANVLKFSRNGSLLLAGGGKGSASGRVVVWKVKTGERVIAVGDELDTVLSADISADQRYIALGGPQKLVRIYSTQTGKLLHEIKKHTDWVCALEFSPDGVLLASGDRNGGVFVWESATAREYLSLKGHSKMITGVSWRSDSNILATASEDASVRLWEMQNGRQVKSWGAHGGGTASVEFTRDGRIVTCGRDRRAKLWDQNGKSLRSFPPFADIALQVTHCDEMNRVIAGDWTGAVRVWNAADGKQFGELSTNPVTLEERLKSIGAKVSQLEAASKSAAATYRSQLSASGKIESDLMAAKKSLADAQKTLKAAKATEQSARATLKKLGDEIPSIEKSLATAEAVIAPLKESVAKAQDALKKSGNDKLLAAAVSQLKSQFDARTASLAAATKSLAQKKAAAATAKQQIAAAQKQAATANTAMAVAAKRIPALTAALKPASVKVAKAKALADAAAKALADARTAQRGAQADLKAEAILKQLASRRSELEQLALAAATKRADAATKKDLLDAANRKLAELQKQASTAAAEQKKAETAVATATAAKSAVENSIKTAESVLPKLKDAVTKAQAAAKASGDKNVAAAVKQIQSALTRKIAELTALKKDLPAKTAALAKLTKPLEAAKKRSVAVQALVSAAKKNADAAGSAYNTAKTAADAARVSADAARKLVQQAQSELAAIDRPASQASAKR